MSDLPGTATGAIRLLMVATPRHLLLIAIFVGLVVLGITTISCLAIYTRGVEALDNEVRADVLRQAKTAAAAIDVDLLQRLTEPEQEMGLDYRQAIAPLERIRNASPDVRFVYTVAMRNGEVHFVLDPTPSGDADGDGVEDHSSLFELYAEANPVLKGVLGSGVAATDEAPVTDRWGTTFSGYAPLRDSRGRLVGAVGVDLDVKVYHERINGMRGAAWTGSLLASCCSLLVGIGSWFALVSIRHAALVSRERQAQLAEARERAEQADHAKGDFLAMMSHEIRTPLNAVIGLADVLVSGGLEGEQREHAETIRASGEHLLAMINDILDYSKIEAGRLDLLSIPFSPGTVAEQAVRLLTETARAKDLRLDLELGDNLPPVVLGDQVRLRQILLNLVGNAVKFTNQGGVRVRVTACDQAGAGERPLRFAVSDTGIGIERATLDRLFQPFHQAAGVSGGSGLGLAISQRLVRLMGGEIVVESALGTGSTFSFTVSFPSAPANAHAPEMSSLHPPRFRGRVLVVDDQAVNRVLASAMLTRLGVENEVVDSGAAALERLLDHEGFDLVLMDVQMPGMDGLVVTSELRREQNRSGRRTPVVALTATSRADDERRCREAGMDGYLTKPLRMETLAEELERWLPVVHDGLPYAEKVPSAAPPPAPDESPVVDLATLATLRSLDNDPQGFTDLVTSYLEDTRRQLATLAPTVAAQRHPELMTLAHTQRGVALTMGLRRFAVALADLQSAAAAADQEAVVAAAAVCEQAFTEAAAALTIASAKR